MTAAATTHAFSKPVRDLFADYVGELNLNLGCGDHPEPGFVNLDRVPGHGADVVFDLERCGAGKFSQLPFASHTVDCVLASHVLEHIHNLIPLLRQVHRILKPGGYLVAVAPYASSDAAVEDPTHVRYFTENSWHYFDKRLYARPGHAGAYPSEVDFAFDVVRVDLVPFEDVQRDLARLDPLSQKVELEVKKRFMRNVIREQHAVLRKVVE